MDNQRGIMCRSINTVFNFGPATDDEIRAPALQPVRTEAAMARARAASRYDTA